MNAKSLTLAATLLLAPTPLLAQFAHPDLKSGNRHVQRLMIMPIQVQLTKLGMKGSEPMAEESVQAQKSLAPVVANVFEKEGYTVDGATVSPEAMEKDVALRYSVDDLQKKFDKVLKLMARKPGDVRRARFSLGDEVAKLPAAENVDALLFVRVNGRILTGGRRVYSFPMRDDVGMRIGLVDARTGDVLYFEALEWLPNPANNPAGTAKGVHKAFKNFFEASPPAGVPGKAQAPPAMSADVPPQENQAPADRKHN